MANVETGVSLPDGGDINRMCRELFWEVEQKLIKHKLAKDYYGFRAFWLQCLPLLLMTTFISIIAFTEYGYASTYMINDDEYIEARQWLVLSAGILGLISTIVTSLIINTRYQSQRDMHAMAERILAKVCQLVRFPERTPGDNDGTRLMEQINKQKAIVVSIECISSNVPPRIEHAFRDLEHTMKMKPYTFRAIQYERFYYALWKMITRRSYGGRYFNLWPLIIPEIDISRSILGKVIEEEFGKYSQGMEVAVKRKSSLMLTSNGISNNDANSNVTNNTLRTSGRDTISEEERALMSSTTSSSTAAEC